MRRLPPVLLALMLLTGCGAWETEAALSLPKTVPAKPISAPAVVTEGRNPTKDYDLPTEVVRQLEWGERMGKPVAKLAELPEQDAAFYAVEEDSSYWALLRWGGSLAEFDWSFGGPLIVEPRLWCRDVDGDGQEEIVLVNHVGSGTGVSIEELHIVEKNLDGTLTDYAFPEELWQEDLSSLLDTAVTADRTFAVLGEELVDITRQLQRIWTRRCFGGWVREAWQGLTPTGPTAGASGSTAALAWTRMAIITGMLRIFPLMCLTSAAFLPCRISI